MAHSSAMQQHSSWFTRQVCNNYWDGSLSDPATNYLFGSLTVNATTDILVHSPSMQQLSLWFTRRVCNNSLLGSLTFPATTNDLAHSPKMQQLSYWFV